MAQPAIQIHAQNNQSTFIPAMFVLGRPTISMVLLSPLLVCKQAMAGEPPPSPFFAIRQQAGSARLEVASCSHRPFKLCSRASRHDDGFVDGVKKLHAGQHRAIRRMTFPSADASPGDIPDFTLGVVIGRYVEKVIAVVDQTRQ